MMRLSIAGWIESLLFATAVLLYISGESGWILVYAIGISAVLSVTTWRGFPAEFHDKLLRLLRAAPCRGYRDGGAGAYSAGILLSALYHDQRQISRAAVHGARLGAREIREDTDLTDRPGMRTQPPGDRLGDPEGFPRDSVPEFQSAPGAGGGGCTAADRGLHRAGGAAEPAPVGR